MLYNVNPLPKEANSQAGFPRAAFRMNQYKIMSYTYSIEGIAGGNHTGPCGIAGTAPCDAPCGVKTPRPCVGGDIDFSNGPVLFDLAADPSETTNIAAANPDVVSTMIKRLEEIARGSVEPQQWFAPYQG